LLTRELPQSLFRDGVLVAPKDYEIQHPSIETKNLFVIKAMQSLTSRGLVKTQYSWRYFYYTMTPEGLDYLREWLHLPAEIVPATHIKQQRSHAPPRGMMGEDGGRGERRFGGRGRGGDRGDRGDREGGYRRRDAGEGGKEGGAPGDFAPQLYVETPLWPCEVIRRYANKDDSRGGFGRGRGAAPPS
jgi:small subunit ribosomal protein S10e